MLARFIKLLARLLGLSRPAPPRVLVSTTAARVAKVAKAEGIEVCEADEALRLIALESRLTLDEVAALAEQHGLAAAQEMAQDG